MRKTLVLDLAKKSVPAVIECFAEEDQKVAQAARETLDLIFVANDALQKITKRDDAPNPLSPPSPEDRQRVCADWQYWWIQNKDK